MTDWKYTYRNGQIPAKAIIHEHTPGKRISDVLTEIQEKAITEVVIEAGPGLRGSAVTTDGTTTIDIALDKTSPDTTGGDGDGLPDGGTQYQVLQRDSSGNAVWDWVRAH